MEIGGLGFIQSQNSSGRKALLPGEGNSGFANLFSNLKESGTVGIEILAAHSSEKGIFNGELESLIQFLRIDDLSQLENGQELLEKALQSETNIADLIADQLNVSKEELLQMLEGFLQNFGPNIKVEDLHPNKANDSNNPEDLEIRALIANISLLNINESIFLQGEELGQTLKALKLFELLAAQQDSFGSRIDLKSFLEKFQEKLDGLLKNSAGIFDKADILQKVFTPLAEEINQLKQKKSAGTENKEDPPPGITRFFSSPQGHIQLQSFSKPEQLLLISREGKSVGPEQLIQQFERILSKSSFLKTGGTQKLFIKLNPDHLGALRVELIQKDSVMIARILTSTASAKELLDSQINGLKQAFSSQNLQVERIEISQQMSQQDRSFNKDPQHQEQGQQQNKEENKKQSFNNSFEEALLNTEV